MNTTHALEDDVVASLAPFSALPRWIAAGMDGHRVGDVLVDHVPELADGRLVACHPERLRAKGGEWLARYRLDVADPGGGEHEVVLTGNLWPPTESAPRAPHGNAAAFGDPGWWCWLPELRLLLQVQEHDTALPALPTLVEPARAARLVQSVLPDAGYPGATVTGCLPDVVRYKPGSRCTVVVHVDYECRDGAAPPPSPVVLKTHQAEKGRTAWAAMSALWERREAWDEARRAFTGHREADLAELRGELGRTGRALAAVHRSGATYERTATVEMELAEIQEVVDRLALTVPRLHGAGRALLDRLGELAAALPPDPVVPAHHDFRPAQVLLHGGRGGFIDFDGAAMAARGDPMSGPALDENLRLQDELCDRFLAAYRAEASVSAARVELWETCDLFTAMLHAWTKVRTARLEPRLAVLRHHVGRLAELGR